MRKRAEVNVWTVGDSSSDTGSRSAGAETDAPVRARDAAARLLAG